MKLYTSERTAILIDGANFNNAMKAIDCEPDYKKLQEYFAARCVLAECAYYTRIWDEIDDDTKEKDYNPLRPLLDFLQYNGWRVVTKKAKEIERNGASIRVGDCDVELACDIIRLSSLVGSIWLFSGNGDFTYPVLRGQLNGCRICVVSSMDPPMVSDSLRREAGGFVDVRKLASEIRREK